MLKPSPKYVVVMSDSLTDNITLGVHTHYLWPELLGVKMRGAGVDVRVRNFARNGSRTDQQLALMPLMTEHGTPDFGIIWGGANDAGGGLTTQNTKDNLTAMVKWLKFGCKGTVATEAALPVAAIGDRYIVLADGSSDGGIDAPSDQGLTAKCDSSAGGGVQTVWECRYSKAGASTWGRIARASTTPDRCDKIIIGGAQYLNYASSAGDNYDVITGYRFSEGTSTDNGTLAGIKDAAYNTLRIAQQQVATAEGVVFCDNFDFVSRKIAAGFHTQGSRAEHYMPSPAADNQHFNRYGHSLIAEAMFAKIAAQNPPWLD
jgi:lysophospholipase L1-like esterase